MAKIDEKLVESVRQAATGRWVTILSTVGGIPQEILNGKEGPCPKCGGTTRFRLIDESRGAVYCNHCFNTKNGDGFAAVGWLADCNFPEAVKRVGEHLGIEIVTKKPAYERQVVPQTWSSQLSKYFLAKKTGVTEQALIDAGARVAKYKHLTVVAFPVIGQKLDADKPVGQAVVNCIGDNVPLWDRDGNVTGNTKLKIIHGSKPGLYGVYATERMKLEGMVELVWKVEGLSDMLALMSAIPESLKDRHLVVSTANGAQENPRWQASLLANFPTNVIHDADEPGQAGAIKWTEAIAAQSSKEIRNVQLPYPVEKTKGKDLRDWLAEHTYADLLALAEQTPPKTVARTETGEVDLTKAEYPMQTMLLKRLQLEILYENDRGEIRVFSTFLRKSSWIRQVDRLKLEALIQVCGAPAVEYIVNSASDADGENSFSMGDVRKAIALIASARRGKDEERGLGVWQGLDDHGNETNTIVLVGDKEGARWNGDRMLRRVIAPRADGLVLDFGTGKGEWFDFKMMESFLKLANDPVWCRKVIEETFNLFNKWIWSNGEDDAQLLVGLVLATWVQTIWHWRPLVSIVGVSNCGKSYFFEALGGSDHRTGLFGNLAFKQAKSTEPGIRQGIGNTARVVLCDEFEQSRDRTKILEMLRTSTRGEVVARGTAGGQGGVQFKMRHISWVAATEGGLDKQPDVNRFIQFTMNAPPASEFGKLELPEGQILYELGQKLLAIAVHSATKAKRLAVDLKTTKVAGIDNRLIESYAVPSAMLSVALGFSEERARKVLRDFLDTVDRDEQGSSDHEDLLEAILTAKIFCGAKVGELTVGQIIQDTRSSYYTDHAHRLEASGMKITDEHDFFICHKMVRSNLLRGTDWQRQRIDQLLIRLSGAARSQIRLSGGKHKRGILIPGDVAGINEPDDFK